MLSRLFDFFKHITPANILRGLLKSKFWLGLIIVVVVGVGGVATYFSMIDWNENKHRIANQFSEITGKRVEFDGPVSFKLFPSPYLSATDVKIYTDNGPDKKLLAKINSLVANLSLVPLIKGDFEVKRMSLVEPEIDIAIMEDGSVNWDTPLTTEQRYSMETIEVTLDSVTLEKARVNFNDIATNTDLVLENLNAEIVALSLLGPYRVEGSYIRENEMEGFAISLGRISRGLSMGVNFVVNYPKYNTYIRFDGSVLPDNEAINGSVIVESAKIADFMNSVFDWTEFGPEYNKPLALSLEATKNQNRISLNNVVVKYGDTVGAGNILIPVDEMAGGVAKRKVEASFNMTDLDLEPFALGLNQLFNKYKTSEYNPNSNIDLILDIKSLKTFYNEQIIRDLEINTDFVDNVLRVKNVSAILPGETNFKLKGTVSSYREKMIYDFGTLVSTVNFDKLLGWLGYQVDEVAPATYKKADIKFNMEGNLDTVKISPFEMAFDKTVIKGELGFLDREDQPSSYFVALNADSINLDNYVRPIPDEVKAKGVPEIVKYYMSVINKINGVDVRAMLSTSLLIAEGVPVDRVAIDFDYSNGSMEVGAFRVEQYSNATIEGSGKISGFENDVVFEELNYKLVTQDITPLLNRLGISYGNININEFKSVSSQGVLTGALYYPRFQGDTVLGNVNTTHNIVLNTQNELLGFDGRLTIKAPDVVKFVNDLGYKYSPKVFSLGLLNFSGDFMGNVNKFDVKAIDAYAGSNNFKGEVMFDKTSGRNNIVANLDINKFEVDRFIYNPNSAASKDSAMSFRSQSAGDRGDFISKPFLSREKFDYAFYNTFDFRGNLNINDLTCKGTSIKKANLEVDIRNAVANVILNGEYKNGTIDTAFDIEMSSAPVIKGALKLDNQTIDEMVWGGRKYGFVDGIYNINGKFATNATSEEDMLSGLDADFEFVVQNSRFKGWKLKDIYNDLKDRKRSDGVVTMIKDNLAGGEALISMMNGKINITNGAFRLNDTVISADNAEIKVEGEGSFNAWDMRTNYNVNFVSLDNVPAFNFSLSGAIISPVLTVEADELVQSYNAYWDKIAEERKATLQAKIDGLNNLMAEQQQRVNALQAEIDVLRTDYEDKKALAEDKMMKDAYDKNLTEVDRLINAVTDVTKYATAVDFEMDLINELKEKNDAIEQSIQKLRGSASSLYGQDVKLRVNDYYNKIVEIYKEAQDQIAYYRDSFSPFQQRIGKIGSDTNLDDNENVIQLENNIEEEFLKIDNINSNIKKNYVLIQNTKILEKLEQYAEDIKDMEVTVKQALEDMKKYIGNLFEYMEKVVSDEEKAYKEELREAEIKKKVEENVGTISVHGTGKQITVVRDIEDIEKAEEALKKEEIRVLDFSKKSSSTSGTIIKDGKVVNSDKQSEAGLKEGSILKKIDDDKIEASGTINRN